MNGSRMTPETAVADTPHEMLPRKRAEAAPPARVALICDYLEERWPSMDLFGDMLFETFTALAGSSIHAEQLRPALRPRFSKLPGPTGMLWNADRLWNRFYEYPAWLAGQAHRFDLFHLMDHSYAQLLLKLPAERTIVTCHDLDTFQCLLEPTADPRPRWFRAMARRTLTGFLRAAHVICVSSFTRDKILQHGLVTPDRISVIHPGADPAFFSSADLARQAGNPVLSKTRSYLLHVGSTIRRKRIDVLLRVFASLAGDFPDLQLVRVGGLTAEQSRLAEELGIASRIVTASNLTKPELADVYRQAILLLQTSDAEGFGLPLIEAMACGCPVVASDIPALREAGLTASEYCPVGQIDAWTGRVSNLLRERVQSPEGWAQRRQKARVHASAYTWTENAKQTISVYDRVRDPRPSGGKPVTDIARKPVL